MPGAMRTVSRPAARNSGQRTSASCAARNNTPSESCGATRLAASPTAKWPTNIGLLRLFVEVVEPLLHERLVQASGFQILRGIFVREPEIFGAIVDNRAASMRVEDPLHREEQRPLIVGPFLDR